MQSWCSGVELRIGEDRRRLRLMFSEYVSCYIYATYVVRATHYILYCDALLVISSLVTDDAVLCFCCVLTVQQIEELQRISCAYFSCKWLYALCYTTKHSVLRVVMRHAYIFCV